MLKVVVTMTSGAREVYFCQDVSDSDYRLSILDIEGSEEGVMTLMLHSVESYYVKEVDNE